MTLGNLAALQQENMKRMLAYSSIAQAGYALMGFVLLSNEGIRAMLVYLFAYYVMDAGAFLVVMIVAELNRPRGYRRLSRTRMARRRGSRYRVNIFLLSSNRYPATIGLSASSMCSPPRFANASISSR